MPTTYQKRTLPSYVITNIELWTQDKKFPKGEIWVENGRLKMFAASVVAPPTVERIDGKRKVVMPAGVDAQVHLRVPGQAHKETPATGLTAALKGGYSAVLTMPNTQPTIDSVEVLEQGMSEVKPFEDDLGVKVFWSAAITKKLNSDEWADYDALVKAGVRAFTNDG